MKSRRVKVACYLLIGALAAFLTFSNLKVRKYLPQISQLSWLKKTYPYPDPEPNGFGKPWDIPDANPCIVRAAKGPDAVDSRRKWLYVRIANECEKDLILSAPVYGEPPGVFRMGKSGKKARIVFEPYFREGHNLLEPYPEEEFKQHTCISGPPENYKVCVQYRLPVGYFVIVGIPPGQLADFGGEFEGGEPVTLMFENAASVFD